MTGGLRRFNDIIMLIFRRPPENTFPPRFLLSACFSKKIISFISISVLIFCSLQSESAVLVEGPYIVPADKVDVGLSADFRRTASHGTVHKEKLDLAFSPSVNFLIGFGISSVSGFNGDVDRTPGDSNFRIKYFLGDFFNHRFSTALLADFTIPTGPNAYESPEYRSISFGNHEIKIALTSRFDLFPEHVIQLFAGYIFRGENGENIYTPLRNNPFSNDSFFAPEKLKNDCLEVSVSYNTDALYPFAGVVELYHMRRVYRGSIENQDIQIDGLGVEPFIAAGEIRYYISPGFFGSFYAAGTPSGGGGYPSLRFGIRINRFM